MTMRSAGIAYPPVPSPGRIVRRAGPESLNRESSVTEGLLSQASEVVGGDLAGGAGHDLARAVDGHEIGEGVEAEGRGRLAVVGVGHRRGLPADLRQPGRRRVV